MQRARLQTPWIYYTIACISSVLMGVSSYVIAFNFMANKVPLLLAIYCSLSGMILNAALYWIDSPKKLFDFLNLIRQNPLNLISKHSLISMISALCVGFLAFKSYIDQIDSLVSTSWTFIPLCSLAAVFSIANVLSTFVLYYSPPDPESPQQAQPSDQEKFSLHTLTTTIIAIAQSFLYSLNTFQCTSQILLLTMPTLSMAALAISFTLSGILMLAECQFNIDVMRKFPNLSPSSQWQGNERIYSILLSLVFANSFANGWISLGGIVNASIPKSVSIVLIGSVVSLTVMLDRLNTIRDLITNFQAHRDRLIPNNNNETYRMINGIFQAAFIPSGLFLIINPMRCQMAMFAFPLTTSIVLVGFSLSVLPSVLFAFDSLCTRLLSSAKLNPTPSASFNTNPKPHQKHFYNNLGFFGELSRYIIESSAFTNARPQS